jgi:putative aldouronate transport system permease protein
MNTALMENKLAAKGKRTWIGRLYSERYLYLMSIPFLIWLVIFKYIPIWGWVTAFQEFMPGKSIFNQKWIGLKQFKYMFTDEQFYIVLRNTLVMSVLSLVANLIFALILALMIDELRNGLFKRTIQTVSYLPHFVSWVIVAGIFYKLLSTDNGIVNEVFVYLGILKEPVQFLSKANLFWPIVTLVEAWKETGWNAIIYLSAIASINQELFEAAKADGAGRFNKIWHVTLPSIRPTIIILFVMNIGFLMNNGFDKQFLLGNPIVEDYSKVITLYVLDYGIGLGRYSYGTAVGIFQSVVSIILLFTANTFAKKVDEGRLI